MGSERMPYCEFKAPENTHKPDQKKTFNHLHTHLGKTPTPHAVLTEIDICRNLEYKSGNMSKLSKSPI